MLAEVLPEWMKDTADTFDRAFDSTNSEPTSIRQAKVLVFLTKELHRAIRILRVVVRSEIANGVEAKSFVAEYDPVANSLNLLLGKLRLLAQKIPAKASGPLARRLLTRLGKIEDDVAETQDYLAKFLKQAVNPLPPLDRESIGRGREDVAAGRVEDLQIIIERLQAGGEL